MIPKRILIFSLAYFPHVGGAEVAVKEITDRLSSNEFEFDMVTLRMDNHSVFIEKMGNVTIYRNISLPIPLLLKKILFPFAAFMKARSLHRGNKYDAVWSIMASYAGFAGMFFKHHFPEIPFLLTIQEGENFERRQGIFKPFFKMIFRRADYIQVISHFLADWARDMGAKCKIEVVPNGVDTEAFRVKGKGYREEIRKKFGFEEKDMVLITTSRLVPKNSVEDVIEAMKFLPENVKFLILGTGVLQKELELKVERLKLKERVRFGGFISHVKLPQYLHAADIFVRTPISEGFGNSYVEAMAAGLPVIASPVGGILDFVKDNETGLFSKIGDAKDIAEKVQKLMNDSTLREKLISNASRMVSEKYEWSFVAQNIDKILLLLTK